MHRGWTEPSKTPHEYAEGENILEGDVTPLHPCVNGPEYPVGEFEKCDELDLPQSSGRFKVHYNNCSY